MIRGPSVSLSSVHLNCVCLLLRWDELGLYCELRWQPHSSCSTILCIQGGALVKDRGGCWDVFLNCLAILFFEPESLTSLELTVLARLTGQKVSGMLLSLSLCAPLTGTHDHTQTLCGLRRSNVSSLCFSSKHCTAEPIPPSSISP